MSYTVTQVSTAADLALAITSIPDYMELVEIAEVEGGYWLITEPDDDMMVGCCCDCHNAVDEAVAASPMYMSHRADDLMKVANQVIDTLGTALKTQRK